MHLQVVYVDDNPETELLPTTVIVVPLPKEGDGVTQVIRWWQEGLE